MAKNVAKVRAGDDSRVKMVSRGGAHGGLVFDLGFHGAFLHVGVIGGPFDNYRPGANADVGICVRAERVPEYGVDIWVPIPDFQVPSERQLAQVENALERAFAAALDGKRVYVGCAGGYGRTGLFLALMAKVAGVKDPVAYVRLHYNSHAVETRDQQRYVNSFDVSRLQRWLCWRTWTHRWSSLMFWWR